MTFTELFTACSRNALMPKVKCTMPIRPKGPTGSIGQVTTIKCRDDYKGVGVKFSDNNYEMWFHEVPANDKRSHYMYELEIINNQCQSCSKNAGTPELHSCPFAEEIHNDDTACCNCCEKCCHECALRI